MSRTRSLTGSTKRLSINLQGVQLDLTSEEVETMTLRGADKLIDNNSDEKQVSGAQRIDSARRHRMNVIQLLFRKLELKTWIEGVVGEKIEVDLTKALKDGKLLWLLANSIYPDCMPFLQEGNWNSWFHMDNIKQFITTMSDLLEINTESLFEVLDLYEEKNIPRVVAGLRAIALEASERFPHLQKFSGKKDDDDGDETEVEDITFTAEQFEQAEQELKRANEQEKFKSKPTSSSGGSPASGGSSIDISRRRKNTERTVTNCSQCPQTQRQLSEKKTTNESSQQQMSLLSELVETKKEVRESKKGILEAKDIVLDSKKRETEIKRNEKEEKIKEREKVEKEIEEGEKKVKGEQSKLEEVKGCQYELQEWVEKDKQRKIAESEINLVKEREEQVQESIVCLVDELSTLKDECNQELDQIEEIIHDDFEEEDDDDDDDPLSDIDDEKDFENIQVVEDVDSSPTLSSNDSPSPPSPSLNIEEPSLELSGEYEPLNEKKEKKINDIQSQISAYKNENEEIKRELFFSLCIGLKLSCMMRGNVSNVDAQELYEQVLEENVQPSEWRLWLLKYFETDALSLNKTQLRKTQTKTRPTSLPPSAFKNMNRNSVRRK